MPKLEQRFDYVKIGLASPDRIRQWGERTLPNGSDCRRGDQARNHQLPYS